MWLNFKFAGAVILAPAAGVTDSLTRQIAKDHGADITVGELVSSEGLVRNHHKTRELLAFEERERPIGLQIFGADPVNMAKAAVYVESLGPDFIDLNFGCPAKKVVGKNGGSLLLLNLPLIEAIITEVVKVVSLPVTIKYRSGWDDRNIVAVEVAQIAEGCGASAVCLHPRTRAQGFSGLADWSLITKVKQAIKIPVIGSGDIDSPIKAKQMFEITGCDAIMVGRASFANPWIFNRIKHYLSSGEILSEPDTDRRISLAIQHLQMSIKHYGYPRGVYNMRHKLAWYLHGLPGAAKIRTELMALVEENKIVDLLSHYRDFLDSTKDVSRENNKALA